MIAMPNHRGLTGRDRLLLGDFPFSSKLRHPSVSISFLSPTLHTVQFLRRVCDPRSTEASSDAMRLAAQLRQICSKVKTGSEIGKGAEEVSGGNAVESAASVPWVLLMMHLNFL